MIPRAKATARGKLGSDVTLQMSCTCTTCIYGHVVCDAVCTQNKMTSTRLIDLMYTVIEIPRNGALLGVI